jgi:hypothetical protein
MLPDDAPPPPVADGAVSYAMLTVLYGWCAETLLQRRGNLLSAQDVSRIMSRTMWITQRFLGTFRCGRKDLQVGGSAP